MRGVRSHGVCRRLRAERSRSGGGATARSGSRNRTPGPPDLRRSDASLWPTTRSHPGRRRRRSSSELVVSSPRAFERPLVSPLSSFQAPHNHTGAACDRGSLVPVATGSAVGLLQCHAARSLRDRSRTTRREATRDDLCPTETATDRRGAEGVARRCKALVAEPSSGKPESGSARSQNRRHQGEANRAIRCGPRRPSEEGNSGRPGLRPDLAQYEGDPTTPDRRVKAPHRSEGEVGKPPQPQCRQFPDVHTLQPLA